MLLLILGGQTSTIRTRINGVNGNLAVSFAAGATGIFEDTTNSDQISVNDLVNLSFNNINSGNQTFSIFSKIEFVGQNNNTMSIVGNNLGAINANTIIFLAVGYDGGGVLWTADAGSQIRSMVPCTVSNLSCRLSANTVSANSTLITRKNGVNGNQSVLITASTTGTFTDITNSDIFTPNDLINLKITAGATGTSLIIETIYMLLSIDSNNIPMGSSSMLSIIGPRR